MMVQYLCDSSREKWKRLRSLPIDLTSWVSIVNIILIVLKICLIQDLLYKNVNCFMSCFPQQLVRNFMNKLRDLLSRINLIRSSITYCSQKQPLKEKNYYLSRHFIEELGALHSLPIDDL
jgi:hypothetical protein